MENGLPDVPEEKPVAIASSIDNPAPMPTKPIELQPIIYLSVSRLWLVSIIISTLSSIVLALFLVFMLAMFSYYDKMFAYKGGIGSSTNTAVFLVLIALFATSVTATVAGILGYRNKAKKPLIVHLACLGFLLPGVIIATLAIGSASIFSNFMPYILVLFVTPVVTGVIANMNTEIQER